MGITHNVGLLLHRIGALMERYSDHILFEAYGLGFAQFKILYIVSEYEHVSQKDIATGLGQSEPSITRQIKILKHAGFVSVLTPEDDRKRRLVTLTVRGREFISDAIVRLNAQYEPILSTLSLKDQQDLLVHLQGLNDVLESRCKKVSS